MCVPKLYITKAMFPCPYGQCSDVEGALPHCLALMVTIPTPQVVPHGLPCQGSYGDRGMMSRQMLSKVNRFCNFDHLMGIPTCATSTRIKNWWTHQSEAAWKGHLTLGNWQVTFKVQWKYPKSVRMIY